MRSCLFIFWILCGISAIAQPQFSAEADTNRILIGEQIMLSLKAKIPQKTDFQWPAWPDSIVGIELVEAQKLDTVSDKGYWRLRQNLILTSFDSGVAAIPPLTFSANGQSAVSQSIGISVSFPELSEEQDYYDIKKPLEPPFVWTPYIYGALILVALIGLVILAIYFIKKPKKPAQPTLQQKLTPYEYAQYQLRELEKEQLWQAGNLKEFYSRLTDILRLFLEKEKRMNAMESTADEVIEQIRTLPISSELKERTARLFMRSSLVKFAKEKTGAAENEQSMRTADQFLTALKPSEKKENVELPV